MRNMRQPNTNTSFKSGECDVSDTRLIIGNIIEGKLSSNRKSTCKTAISRRLSTTYENDSETRKRRNTLTN